MRDYFLEPAQTNLELYRQAVEHGYDRHERQRLAEAYQFALRQVFPLARGSGKPFIAHLVGTASLTLASDRPSDWVTAALMHALYQRRIPFRDGLSPAERRLLVAERFGADVDELIQRYTDLESRDLSELLAEQFDDNVDVVTLRLADELEDLGGHAFALYGTSSDEHTRGGSRWRRDAKVEQGPALLELARRLGLDGIGQGLAYWLDSSATPDGLEDMRTGWFSSVNLATEAYSRDD